MNDGLESCARALKGKERVLLVSHMNPDGDAIGSAAALGWIARAIGSDVRLLLVTGLPDYLAWLPLPGPWVRTVEDLGSWVPDLVAALDCGDAERAGPVLASFFLNVAAPAPGWEAAATLNIDHHLDNPCFAGTNWADHTRSATGEMVGLLAEHMGLALEGDLAKAVYMALVADTGNFTYSNTSAEAMAMAARILKKGLDLAGFTDQYENNWTLARMRLWGRLMSEVNLYAGGAVACTVVPQRYLTEMGLKKADLEGFASSLRRIKGVRVVLYIREDAPGRSKISLRSSGGVDVNRVAVKFGGGGHTAASGIDLPMDPEDAKAALLPALEQLVRA